MIKDAVENDLIVVKRSGQRVPFNGTKIALAIKKGYDSVYPEYDEKIVNKIYEKVLKTIEKEYTDRKTIGIEEVQDIIEKELKKQTRLFIDLFPNIGKEERHLEKYLRLSNNTNLSKLLNL